MPFPLPPSRSFVRSARLALVPCAALGFAPPSWAQGCSTERWSTDAAAAQADLGSGAGTSALQRNYVSADMRLVAFWSDATNLVPGDTNASGDVFVKDRASGAIERVSVDGAGLESDGFSTEPAISADGRIVVFQSLATNLVPNDTNARTDVFVRDRVLGTTVRVSVDGSGVEGNHNSTRPDVSADGRFVAFQSRATNLVPNDTNARDDVFVVDLTSGAIEIVSVDSSGAIGLNHSGAVSLSADGRFVAFHSLAQNLVAGDTNAEYDVFVRDRTSGTTSRVSTTSGGGQANFFSQTPSISADGRYVAFSSVATNLVANDTNNQFDVFWKDRLTGRVVLCSKSSFGELGNSTSQGNSISGDGRYVGFASQASNLVTNDTNGGPFALFTDVFVHDVVTGATDRLSVDTLGNEGLNGSSYAVCVARDGSGVAFYSASDTLVASDTNAAVDVFVRSCGVEPPPTELCFGDGTGGACPCANLGAAGRGCENSFTTGGARISANGVPSVAADSVQIQVSGLPPTSVSVLIFQGDATVNQDLGGVFGDGLRCAGGAVLRLGSRFGSGGTLTFGAGVVGDPSIAAQGMIPSGTVAIRYYQAWYRNVASFCTPSAFNLSNAVRLTWIP